jgi:enterochelin esterase-like enzyme
MTKYALNRFTSVVAASASCAWVIAEASACREKNENQGHQQTTFLLNAGQKMEYSVENNFALRTK